jgi:cytidine deaminase
VASGGRRVVEAAVVGTARSPDTPLTPCGGCRQRLREFAGPDLRLWLADETRTLGTRSLGQLLPESFGPQALGRPDAS